MEETTETRIGALLRVRGWKLATAESCTGGLIADRLTNVPGSSDYFAGAIVAYAYEAKVALLGIAWETLEAHGAVSREVVLGMARGVCARLGVQVGLAVSGIAGPGGGQPGKPVGTTWIGLVTPEREHAQRFRFEGTRLENKAASADRALGLLLHELRRAV